MVAPGHDIFALLSDVLETEHFMIHYTLRNPVSGPGRGRHGVKDPSTVSAYAEACERAHRTLIGPPFSRRPPVVGRRAKTDVWVFDIAAFFRSGGPFVALDAAGVPYIALSASNSEPTEEASRQRAMAEAACQVAHIFNARERPLIDPASAPWCWMDTATSILVESYVLPENDDYLRYADQWISVPERSLDDRAAWYAATWFLRYLAESVGVPFLSRLWMEAEANETPIDAIQRLSSLDGLSFIDERPDAVDLFSSYCTDAYFLWDDAGTIWATGVYERYGERAITESFELNPGTEAAGSYGLDRLACRYYRLVPDTGVQSVHVRLELPPSVGSPSIKSQLINVTRERRRGSTVRLRPDGYETLHRDGASMLSGEIVLPVDGNTDHLVLVVANYSLKSTQRYSDPLYRSSACVDYTIRIAAR